jgi:hypothetical protein
LWERGEGEACSFVVPLVYHVMGEVGAVYYKHLPKAVLGCWGRVGELKGRGHTHLLCSEYQQTSGTQAEEGMCPRFPGVSRGFHASREEGISGTDGMEQDSRQQNEHKVLRRRMAPTKSKLRGVRLSGGGQPLFVVKRCSHLFYQQ